MKMLMEMLQGRICCHDHDQYSIHIRDICLILSEEEFRAETNEEMGRVFRYRHSMCSRGARGLPPKKSEYPGIVKKSYRQL